MVVNSGARRGSNRMWPVRAARYSIVVLLAAALTASNTGIAAAAVAPGALGSCAAVVPDPTMSREEREERVLQRLFAAIEAIPENLHDRTTADKEVQDAVVRNYRNSGTLGAAPVVQQVAAPTDPAGCAAAIVKFLAENVVPVGKFIRIIREAGGVIKFARYVYEFVRKGTLPAEASKEAADFIISLTGFPGVISACAQPPIVVLSAVALVIGGR